MNEPIKKKNTPSSLQQPGANNTLAGKLAADLGNTSSKKEPDFSSDLDKVDKRRYIYTVSIGDSIELSNIGGDFIGRPYLNISSYQHNTFSAVINDPGGTIFSKLSGQMTVIVKIGFAPGNGSPPVTIEKFRGKLFHTGIKKPTGCIILAVDEAYNLQTNISPGIIPTSTPIETPPPESSTPQVVVSSFTGGASFYGGGDGFDGKKTANGEIFNADKLTAAHKTLPFGTMVKVTNSKNGKSVVVRINDRGPYAKGRVLDLSRAAASQIGMIEAGVAQVKGEILGKPSPQKTQPQTDPKIQKMISDKNRATSSPVQVNKTTTEVIAKDAGNSFATTSSSSSTKSGNVNLQQSGMNKAATEAYLQGDVLVSNGKTLEQVGPGQASPTDLILDYAASREAFVTVNITKKTGLQLQSGYGAVTVMGWNTNNKEVVGATVVTPLDPPPHPTGIVQVPDWGKIKLNEPIFPGCIYTWADATMNGTRVPTKEIMGRIAAIAQVIQGYTDKTVAKGKKWTITSWYRTPEANRRCGGAKNSRHLYGDAVDFIFPGAWDLYTKLNSSWNGGVARKQGQFVHIDLGSKRRWEY